MVKSFIRNKLLLNTESTLSVTSKILTILGGLLSITILVQTLNQNELAYYYTFGSIISMQVFFELGMISYLSQIISKEYGLWGFTKSSEKKLLQRARLASILKGVFRIWIFLYPVAFLFLSIAGYLLINEQGSLSIDLWLFPLLALIFTNLFLMVLNSCYAILEGFGFVKEISLCKLIYQSIYLFIFIFSLRSGLHLFSPAVAIFSGIIIIFPYLLFKHIKHIRPFLYSNNIKVGFVLRKELFPFFSRISVSWMAGFFIFSSIIPISFRVLGEVFTAKLGVSLSLLNSISSLMFSWYNVRIPYFSNLTSVNEHARLKNEFFFLFKTTSVILGLILTICTFLVFLCSIDYPPFNKIRIDSSVLAYEWLSFLSLGIFFSTLTAFLSYYLRLDNKEPLLYVSLVASLCMPIFLYFSGSFLGVGGFLFAFNIVHFSSFVWAAILYRKKTFIASV